MILFENKDRDESMNVSKSVKRHFDGVFRI